MSVWPFVPDVRVEIGLSGPTVGPLVWHVGDTVRGKIGTAQIGAPEVWSDISAAVVSWSFQRGATRSDGLNLRYEPGTCTVVLNNGDRAFDPTNTAGPYASGGVTQLNPMVRVRITATWAGVAYPLYTGFANSWLPDYDSPTWSTTTLTATDAFKVFGAQDRTAGSAVGVGELSGARVNRILDGLGWLTDDRIIAAGDTALQATTLDGNGLTELLLVQDTELGELYMSPSGDLVFRNRHAILTDARSNTAQATFGDGGLTRPMTWGFESGVADFNATGATITSSTAQAYDGAFSLLMTVAGSPSQAYTRQNSGPFVTVGHAYTGTFWVYYPAGGTVGAAIDWYTAGGGYLSTSSSSLAVSAGVWTQLSVTGTAPASAGKAVFGPTLGSSPANGTQLHLDTMLWADAVPEIPYASIAVENDDSTMANSVSIARVGGTEQLAEDATSIAKYLRKTYQRTDLLHQTDTESLNYAKALLSQAKDPELRFTEIGFDNLRPDVCALGWPALLGRELGDRITVIRRPPGGGSPNQRDVFVRRIEMSSDGPTWKTALALESAERQDFWTIGNPTLGRIGLNAIAY